MKCPKCSYLGFETGDRCKNCGYDFSLLASNVPSPSVEAELTMRPDDGHAVPDIWLDHDHHADASVRDVAIRTDPAIASKSTAVATAAPVANPRDLSFPLFSPRREDDDEPLIKLPATPRPPLAVRRTPDQPRLRPPAKPPDHETRLALEVADDVMSIPDEVVPTEAIERSTAPEVSSLARRLSAGVIDLALLSAIDLLIVYSTLRMSALTMGEWALLPPVPMLAFLGLLKLAYFGAFTAACGQTIGKMAMRIRVVADDVPLDPARAARRTLVSAVSLLAAGAGFLPVLVDPDRRALHDRLAGTRVVQVPSV